MEVSQEQATGRASIRDWGDRIKQEVGKAIYGKDEVIDLILTALLCRGHVLLEDVPGVGKTILARALSRIFAGNMKRIQCTPDLMPSDVIGISMYNQKKGEFQFREGPVMTNFLLVDEINRAAPRTQSALLEAMEERVVTIEGVPHKLPEPFFLVATENPVEFEGTFPLPEAQKDRFFLATRMGYPNDTAELEIMESHRRTSHPVDDISAVSDFGSLRQLQSDMKHFHVAEEILAHILKLVRRTRNDDRIKIGASPRASLALSTGIKALAGLRGIETPTIQELEDLFFPVLWKRIELSPATYLKGLSPGDVLKDIFDGTPLS